MRTLELNFRTYHQFLIICHELMNVIVFLRNKIMFWPFFSNTYLNQANGVSAFQVHFRIFIKLIIISLFFINQHTQKFVDPTHTKAIICFAEY